MDNALHPSCRFSLCVTAFLFVSAVVSFGACQDEKPAIKVTLVEILATEEGNTIDKRLKDVAVEIQKLYPNLKSFELKNMQSKSLKPGEKVSLPIIDKKQVQMVIKHGANAENRVSLAVTAPTMGEIEYQTCCGKFLPIVTRYQTKNRERLILAIRVQPCNGEK